MGFIEDNKKPNINDGVKSFRGNKNSVLLDVRTKEEYNAEHIDGSINIPIQSLEIAQMVITHIHYNS